MKGVSRFVSLVGSRIPMTRRTLNKAILLAFFPAFAWASKGKYSVKDPANFDMDDFVSWFKAESLYNGPNPNLKAQWGHVASLTFRETMDKMYSPGVQYQVNPLTVMHAMAPGEVMEMDEITGTGRAGGKYIIIRHDMEMRVYRSNFSHVEFPQVKVGQKVKRGDPVCKVPNEHIEHAKIMFHEGQQYIDPDNYGKGHGFMDYYKSPLEFDDRWQKDKGFVLKGAREQKNIIEGLNKRRTGYGKDKYGDLTLLHNPGGYKPTRWSMVEQFRFLEALLEAHPQSFTGLTPDEFASIRTKFHENQPVVLTLPFKQET